MVHYAEYSQIYLGNFEISCELLKKSMGVINVVIKIYCSINEDGRMYKSSCNYNGIQAQNWL